MCKCEVGRTLSVLPWVPALQSCGHRVGSVLCSLPVHWLQNGLVRVISVVSLSYLNVFSLWILVGWGPLHSHCKNLLSALSVLFCRQSICFCLEVKKHMTNEGLCTLTIIWPRKLMWIVFYWAYYWNHLQSNLVSTTAFLLLTTNTITAFNKERPCRVSHAAVWAPGVSAFY